MDRYVFTKTKKSSGNLVPKRVILQEEQCGKVPWGDGPKSESAWLRGGNDGFKIDKTHKGI